MNTEVQNEKGNTETDNCSVCGKKLKITDLVCKCNLRFCKFHKYPESHNCIYDYKSEQRKLLEKNNPVITPTKVES